MATQSSNVCSVPWMLRLSWEDPLQRTTSVCRSGTALTTLLHACSSALQINCHVLEECLCQGATSSLQCHTNLTLHDVSSCTLICSFFRWRENTEKRSRSQAWAQLSLCAVIPSIPSHTSHYCACLQNSSDHVLAYIKNYPTITSVDSLTCQTADLPHPSFGLARQASHWTGKQDFAVCSQL